MKRITILMLALGLAACGGDDSSDGDASTYDTCRITDSDALFADDRANDISQCWKISSTSDKNKALAACSSLVTAYIADEYLIGHSVEYSVASSSCN